MVAADGDGMGVANVTGVGVGVAVGSGVGVAVATGTGVAVGAGVIATMGAAVGEGAAVSDSGDLEQEQIPTKQMAAKSTFIIS